MTFCRGRVGDLVRLRQRYSFTPLSPTRCAPFFTMAGLAVVAFRGAPLPLETSWLSGATRLVTLYVAPVCYRMADAPTLMRVCSATGSPPPLRAGATTVPSVPRMKRSWLPYRRSSSPPDVHFAMKAPRPPQNSLDTAVLGNRVYQQWAPGVPAETVVQSSFLMLKGIRGCT